MPETPLLAIEKLSRRFGAFTALESVDFSVRAGEIVALLGENGAGKSTLLNVVAGTLAPSSGELRWQGKAVHPKDARATAHAGIGVVYQHFRLVPSLSVAQNLALAAHDGEALFRASVWEQRAHEWAASLGWKLDGAARIETLGVGERQRVEILKALFCGNMRSREGTRLLLLDEPTANLTPDEARELFRVARELRERGCAIVFVSHKLPEVMALCDRVVVLRRGKIVGAREVAQTSPEELARLMVGADAEAESVAQPQSTVEIDRTPSVALELKNIGGTTLRDVSFSVHEGEIVALAGVDGNGQRELVDILAGLRAPVSGHIEATGRIAVVPPDRNREGLISNFDIAENCALDADFRRRFRHRFAFDWKAARVRARELASRFDVRTPLSADNSDRAHASQLSGGNAQKVVLARALDSDAPVLVAADPTRGLDIHAARFVHAQLRAAAARGTAVLVITSDLDEALALGDRIGAMYSGRVLPKQLLSRGTSRETLGALMGGTAGAPEIDRTLPGAAL